MLRWLSVGQVRRSCLYSPRKCFALLLATAGVVSVVLMWNQSSPERRRAAPLNAHPPPFIASQFGNLSLSSPFLLPGSFTFRITPRVDVCGAKRGREAHEVELRDRFEELLEARPDGEDPEVPPPTPSYGVIFVPVLAQEKHMRQAVRRTWGSGGWQRTARARVIFICGRHSESEVSLQTEANLYSDILQLNLDEDAAFPAKRLPGGLAWIEQTCSTAMPTFVAKCHPAVFLNRDSLLRSLDALPSGLHGHLDSHQSLATNFYLIKGSEAIENLLLSLTRVKYQPEEDSFLLDTLAVAAGLNRYPLPGFGGGAWQSTEGCGLVHQTIFTDLPRKEFGDLWWALTDKAKIDCRLGGGCCEDDWNLAVVLGSIFVGFLLLQLSIVHTYFWSSLALFCSDICNTVDSGVDDEEDSDADLEQDDRRVDYDGVVAPLPEHGDPGFLFDIHRSGGGPVDGRF